jgi:P4 family phage/plasmid primase-like protien
MQAGWRIIPLHRVGPDGKTCSCAKGAGCPSAGKHPKSQSWSAAEPMSSPDVYATWDVDKAPNLGVVTGEPSGIWVLDIDGQVGQDSLRRLIAANGDLPKTRLHKTGSGGYHFIFKLTAGHRPKTHHGVYGADYPNIDVRGVGGQIVLPPSKTTGEYVVVRDVEPMEAPAWLLELTPTVDDDRQPIELAADDLAEYDALSEPEKRVSDRYVDAAVAGVVADLEALPRPWREGAGWDQGVHRAACRLFELAQQSWSKLTYADAYALLEGHAPRDSEWGGAEVEAKWLSAQSTVGKKPLPRPKGSAGDDRMEAWGFDEPTGTIVQTQITEEDVNSVAPAKRRRLRFKFDAENAFSEPDEKGRRHFQPVDVAEAIRAARPVANGDDGVLWAHDNGIWSPQPLMIQDSLSITLGNALKPSMINEVSIAVAARSPRMVVGPTPDVINFRNGMLRWKTLELGPHDPAQFSTTQLPHNWNPDAKCPGFDQFLEESLPPEGVQLAWEILAVALYSGNPIQRAVLLYGPPASGKSVFLDVVGRLLGEENVARVPLQGLSGRFNTAELYGRAANICADIDATKVSETGTFKMVSVNDEIQAERKNKDPFRFTSFATLFFSANTIPTSEDRSGAWTRRFALLHFPTPRPVEKRVLNFSDVLMREAEGIIAKALTYLEGVLLRKDYSLIAADQQEFERKTNYILQFIEDELIRGDLDDEECFTPTQAAQWRYEQWCREEGYEHPASWKKVTETLTQQGFKAHQRRLPGGGKTRGWRGFTLSYKAPANASAGDPYQDR